MDKVNKKAQFGFLTLGPIIAILIAILIAIVVLVVGLFVFVSFNKLIIIGAAILVGDLYLAGHAMTSEKFDNKKIGFVLIVAAIGICFIALPYTGMIQNTAYATTITPVYCNQYSFIGCDDTVKTINLNNNNQQYYKCPTNVNSLGCVVQAISGNNGGYYYTGTENCQVGLHLIDCMGYCFECSDGHKISIGVKLNSEYYIYSYGSWSATIAEHSDQLVFAGRGGAHTPITGANGCVFDPKSISISTVAINDPNTPLQPSYVVQTGKTITIWEQGDRTICGNLEEDCKTDADCSGHTYGNYEAYGQTLQYYGCVKLPLPAGVSIDNSNQLFGGFNTQTQTNNYAGVHSRCDMIASKSKTVQCTSDPVCGNGMFCDTNINSQTAWTCQPTKQCTTDDDCLKGGVSQTCDFANKQIQTSQCKNNQCVKVNLKSITCCSSTDCPSGQYCDTDNSCKQGSVIKVDCPNQCCLNDPKYFDMPCANGQFCVSGQCQATGCTTDSQCKGTQICDNGNCKDMGSTNCAWYQSPYTTNSVDNGILGWRKLIGNPIVNTKSGCETSSWVALIIILSFITVIVIISLVLMFGKKKRKRRHR